MTQQDLNRAVAGATSEPVSLIAAIGFSLLALPSAPVARSRPVYPLRLGSEARESKPRRRGPKPFLKGTHLCHVPGAPSTNQPIKK